MKKKRSIASRSAASRKAWRVRQKMTAARREILELATPHIEAIIRAAIETDKPISFSDYRRTLPNPWMDMFK